MGQFFERVLEHVRNLSALVMPVLVRLGAPPILQALAMAMIFMAAVVETVIETLAPEASPSPELAE